MRYSDAITNGWVASIGMTDFFAWHYCAFLSVPTMIISGVATAVASVMCLIATADMLDDDRTKAALVVACGASLVILGMPILSGYNANEDMVQTIKALGSPTNLEANARLQHMEPYPAGDPATQFIDKFMLTVKHPTALVEDSVIKRADYLSSLYTHKYLMEGATTPHFGFVHADKHLVNNTMWYNNIRHRTTYKNERRQGMTARYVDRIVNKAQSVIAGHTIFYNHYARRLKSIESVQKQPSTSLASIHTLSLLSKNSKQHAFSIALNDSLGDSH
jgi:hypothetical protein